MLSKCFASIVNGKNTPCNFRLPDARASLTTGWAAPRPSLCAPSRPSGKYDMLYWSAAGVRQYAMDWQASILYELQGICEQGDALCSSASEALFDQVGCGGIEVFMVGRGGCGRPSRIEGHGQGRWNRGRLASSCLFAGQSASALWEAGAGDHQS